MRKLSYAKLEQQDRLKTLDVKVKMDKTLFRFRCRMRNFSGNFKGKGPSDSCPFVVLISKSCDFFVLLYLIRLKFEKTMKINGKRKINNVHFLDPCQ